MFRRFGFGFAWLTKRSTSEINWSTTNWENITCNWEDWLNNWEG